METKTYACASQSTADTLEVYSDADALIFKVTIEWCDYICLNRNQVIELQEQLQEYLNETSESTPA